MSTEEDVFGPPQWELDSVMKTSVTKKFKVKEQQSEPQVLRTEMEAYRRDIQDKNNQIQKLEEKREEYKTSCNLIHNLILEFEKVCDHKFFSKQQRQKQILITHMDYTRLLKESILYICHQNELLEEKFTQDFTKFAQESSDKIISIKNEFLEVRKQNKKWQTYNQQARRFYEINEKERQSLQQIVDSLGQEKQAIDQNTTEAMDSFRIQMDKLNEERKNCREDRKEKEKKYTKLLSKKIPALTQVKRKRQKYDTTLEDAILQKEIQELSKRYDMESALYERTKAEYDHICNEIQRGKEHLEKHKKALSKQELQKAQKVNLELKEYIEKERKEDKIKFDSQVKKNKELERTVKEHLEEQQMLKQYLSQLERKVVIQSSKLPSLHPNSHQKGKETNQNLAQASLNIGSRYKNDDIEMKLVKRAMSTIARKKHIRKTNLPSRY